MSGKDNLVANFHPYWSQLTVFYPIQDTPDPCKGRWTTTTSASVLRGTTYPPQLTENDKVYTGVDETVVYVTIVNGSPYDFILSSTHTYQMDTFDFHDIPAGKSVQNVMKYNSGVGSSVVDDKGEAYYTLKGTEKTFVVEARTDFGGSGVNPYRVDIYFNGMSTHNSATNTITEFQAPGGQRAVNFVLAGDETLGYWSSVTPPTAWMSSILPVNGESALVSASNVRTQLFGIGDQLRKGSRYFDVPPVQGNGGEYLTGHYNWPNSPHLGANGQSLQEIVDQINAFTASNPELIILYLSHALDTDNGYVVLNDTQWDKVYDIFEGITHRCPNLDGEITDITMNKLIGHGTACVLLISEGTINRPKSGIYPTSQFSSDVNHWSETDSIKDMRTDQISCLFSHRNLLDPTSNDARITFLVTQWILTLTSVYDNTYFSIEDWAVRYAYDPLFWDFSPPSRPGCTPMYSCWTLSASRFSTMALLRTPLMN
ncbi:hypothetical protein CNMCM7691_003687 [Aspergillus felis]|uniref:PLC-like phosphodiesterase n=1 Tax=Aspergillus felis TaxID=1287682 RepID=A0A8H6R2M6_9EURO|nr:hypothetical protein CNMCM7691_003687 [Aspergillus felis]